MAEKINIFFNKSLFENWQQKSVALFSAIIIWFMVNNSITISKTIPNVPIRIINLPSDQTIEGLLPTGFLKEGLTLTLKGKKNSLERLDSSDLEIVLDVYGKTDEWIGDVSPKNLLSLHPEINLHRDVSRIIHPEFIVKLSKLATRKIPIRITKPTGEPPKGFQFLDIWPQQFYHTVSGPERLVEKLKKKGIDLSFDLDEIPSEDLQDLQRSFPNDDEIYFFVPNNWKKISIPFEGEDLVEINDPSAYNLHIIFLHNEFLPLEQDIPIAAFFPQRYSSRMNPNLFSIKANKIVEKANGLTTLKLPLYAHNVSRQFLDLVKEYLQISIIAEPQKNKKRLDWNVQFINPHNLEDMYIQRLLPKNVEEKNLFPELHEKRLRERFRDYMQHFALFTNKQKKLALYIKIQSDSIVVETKNSEEDISFLPQNVEKSP